MFEESERKEVVKGRSDNAVALDIMMDRLEPDELIDLHDQVRARMRRQGVAMTLQDMNVEEELLLQFQIVRKLQGDVIGDGDIAVNQRAQVANAVTSSLTKLADMQGEVWGSERAKRVELLLIRHLTKLPEDVAAAFIDDFERAFGTAPA